MSDNPEDVAKVLMVILLVTGLWGGYWVGRIHESIRAQHVPATAPMMPSRWLHGFVQGFLASLAFVCITIGTYKFVVMNTLLLGVVAFYLWKRR